MSLSVPVSSALVASLHFEWEGFNKKHMDSSEFLSYDAVSYPMHKSVVAAEPVIEIRHANPARH